jgi:hypothetical protein
MGDYDDNWNDEIVPSDGNYTWDGEPIITGNTTYDNSWD